MGRTGKRQGSSRQDVPPRHRTSENENHRDRTQETSMVSTHEKIRQRIPKRMPNLSLCEEESIDPLTLTLFVK